MKAAGQKVKKLEIEYKSIQQDIRTILLDIPNIPRPDVPEEKTNHQIRSFVL
ncbi:MAG: hypothetical protein CM1200mP8_6010 [Chloroflexota bacterium]|nr:MAG: hypothetical protein CM1200mP8_6010 [Chloroflexota bacterium]